jgi:hypothetical protein
MSNLTPDMDGQTNDNAMEDMMDMEGRPESAIKGNSTASIEKRGEE